MTADLTAEQIREAEVRLWREERQRDYGPGAELIGNDRVVSAALRAYADLLDRIESGDTIRIDKVDGEWDVNAHNTVIDWGVEWRQGRGNITGLFDALAKGRQG